MSYIRGTTVSGTGMPCRGCDTFLYGSNPPEFCCQSCEDAYHRDIEAVLASFREEDDAAAVVAWATYDQELALTRDLGRADDKSLPPW